MEKNYFCKLKKNNLGDFNGYSYYYHDIRNNERIMSRHQMGRRLVS